MNNFKEIVSILNDRNETIATMESCTGGGVANQITNIEGASNVLKFSAVTYSNEYKIKMGVSSEVIDKFSVYSIETAHEMARSISEFANSTYGIGITGKLNRADEANNYGLDNEVFVSIYKNGKYYDLTKVVNKSTREENKQLIIDDIIQELGRVINEENK
jgi:PncC family amidohydrolase